MGTATGELQAWLNSKGAQLTVDGKGGPATRAAVIETFRNRQAPPISSLELRMIADRLRYASARQVAAVAMTEGAGQGWDAGGLVKCLWERHYLFKRIAFAIPFLSDPKPGGYTIDADHDGINDSWEKLAQAAARFGAIAFECASFGKFQIMGAHWKKLGYPSVLEFVWQLSRCELAHYEAFARYLEAFDLVGALKMVDGNGVNARYFALGYNGPKGVANGYHETIAHNYRVWK